ncbi:MAG: hypothetical protein HKN67_09460 [Saprospiraceae bacterium]|nr:hypothetical protein [Saprospiraceae bacterium]
MKKYIIASLVIALWACESKKGPSKEDFEENLEEMTESTFDVSDENITNILNSIPSPLEISFIIHDTGIEYDKAILNSENNVSKYNSNNQKAINLGVYGTDLGYTDIYEQNQHGLLYLSVIKDLADDLGIGQFFDFQLIRDLTENSKNLDSLLLVTNDNFNRINDHFQEQNRSSLSSMLLFGGWVESLHLTCQVTLQNIESEDLVERIGEQKIILENMMILLDAYGAQDAYIKELGVKAAALQKAFDDVEITYTYEESTSKIVDGVLVIQNNSSSSVNITPEKVKEIADLTAELRNEITG